MEDTSGPALQAMLREKLGAEIVAWEVVPDEEALIAGAILAWARETPLPDLILTTGGTGLSPRDVTPEATGSVLERRHDALLQLAYLRCMSKTPKTFLSRGVAGTIGQTLVINLPGSRKGSTEMLEALVDVLPHAIATMRGESGDHGAGVR
jgi:molybdenum cofactor synthesis domain-containing protein